MAFKAFESEMFTTMAAMKEINLKEEDGKELDIAQPDNESFLYSNPNQSKQFLEGLSRIQDTSEFADITLCVEETKLKCHKLVLSLASPYFYTMFTSGMKESTAAEVAIKGIDPAIFSMIINFIYKGEILIEESNFQSLLEASAMLQLEALSDGCVSYMETNFTPHNCLSIWMYGQRINHESLIKTSLAYATKHFDQVHKEEEFFTLSAQDLCHYIAEDTVNVKSEDEIGHGVMAWLQRDPSTRLKGMRNILLHLRMNHLSSKCLRDMMCSDPIKESSECMEVMNQALDMQLCPEEHMFELHSTLPRPSMGVKECLVVFGRSRTPEDDALRIKELQETGKVQLSHYRPEADAHFKNYDQYYGESRPVLAVPLQNECHPNCICIGSANPWRTTNERAAACRVGNHIFLAGVGQCCDEIWKYDVNRKEWQKCASLSKIRSPSCAVAISDKIYLFGGIVIQDHSTTHLPLAHFEEYCIQTDKCRVVGELERPVQDMACAVHQGTIYVLGGTDDTRSPTALTQLINIHKNPATTEQGPALPFAAKRLGVARYKDMLLVVTEEALLCYDISFKVWKTVSSLGVGAGFFGCCLVNHCLYVLGGGPSSTDRGEDTSAEKTPKVVHHFGYSRTKPTPTKDNLYLCLNNVDVARVLSAPQTDQCSELSWQTSGKLPQEFIIDSVCSFTRTVSKYEDYDYNDYYDYYDYDHYDDGDSDDHENDDYEDYGNYEDYEYYAY